MGSVPGQLGSEKITFFCQGAGGALETLEQYCDGMASDGTDISSAIGQSATSGSGSGAQITFNVDTAGVTDTAAVDSGNKGTGYKVGDLVSYAHADGSGNAGPVATFIVTSISSVTCNEDEGLPKEELSVGDFVKVGNDIAKVNAVEFQTKSSKTSTKTYKSVSWTCLPVVTLPMPPTNSV